MLSSIKTQIPFSYNYLDLCVDDNIYHPNETFTELLTGTRAQYSNYIFEMNYNVTCLPACYKELTEDDIETYKWLIDRNYYINFYLDSLRAGRSKTHSNLKKTYTSYMSGIPIGFLFNETYYIYNHYNIYIEVNKKDDKFQIVGFSIEPLSILQNSTEECNDLIFEDNTLLRRDYNNFEPQELSNSIIYFTYDVIFINSNKTFSSRWDRYVRGGIEYHWLGLVYSNILLFIFSFIVICILSRAIKKDIEIYNQSAINDNIIDEYGWKLVCNDVFRKPKNLMLFSTFIGTGIQLLLILLVSLIYNLLGYTHPEQRGNLLNQMVICFCFMSFFGGFISTTVYKNNKGKEWLKNTIVTALFFPGISLIILIIVRILFSLESSTVGLKISEILKLLILWMCVSTPLILFGSFLAIKRSNIKYPCKVNVLPTAINDKPWYLKLKYISWFTGLIPFITIIIEFIYLMGYMWRFQVYYLASFLVLSIFFLVVLSSEVSIIFVYLNLCKGDYNWWWKSFFVSASPVLYIAAYSIYYFLFINITRFTAIVVYFLIMALICTIIALICGSCGVINTFIFLKYIYSKIKID